MNRTAFPGEMVEALFSEGADGESDDPLLRNPFLRYFGDYELLEQIGRGGMGIVYRARQMSLERVVAVKMILAGHFACPDEVERFHQEARSAAALNHPNIAAIHEIGEHEGRPFFSMDYIAGRRLGDLVREQPLPDRRAAQIVQRVAEAVQYAHEHGVLHRDLKPSNILVDDTGRPYVTDFGLAKRLDQGSELTLSADTIGSPSYLPPEQASKGKVSAGSDVYSLGAILYHLLTGRPPFVADSVTETLRKVLQEEPLPPRLLNTRIARDLGTICLKCLEKSPTRRYSSARELGEELGRFLEGKPIAARPVGPAGRTWRWCRRKPLMAGLVGAVALAVSLGVLGIAWQWHRAEVNLRQTEKENYYAAISLAGQYIEQGRIDLAQQRLFECPDEFRDWEWGHLLYRCHREIWSVQAHQSPLKEISFHPSGKLLGTLSWPRPSIASELRFWDVRSGTLRFSFGQGDVGTFTFHPKTGEIAVAVGQEIVFLDADTGAVMDQWKAHDGAINSLEFHPNGTQLLTAAWDGRACIWDAATRQKLKTLESEKGPILYASFSSDGDRIITRGRNYSFDGSWLPNRPNDPVQIWNRTSGVAIRQLNSPDDHPLAMFPNPMGEAYVTLDEENRLSLWRSAAESVTLTEPRGVSTQIAHVFFSPDGALFAVPGMDGTARLWETATGRERYVFPGHVFQIGFSPDGTTIITHQGDGRVTLWDVATLSHRLAPRTAQFLDGHHRLVPVHSFDSAGRLVATGGGSGFVRLWPIEAGLRLPGPEDLQRRIAVAANEQLAGAVNHNGISLIAMPGGHQTHSWKGHFLGIHSQIAIHPAGDQLATAADEFIRIWQTAPSPKLLTTLTGHERTIECLAYSPNGRFLISGSRDRTLRVWNGRTFELENILTNHQDPVLSIAFSPDGRRMATGSGMGFDTVNYTSHDAGIRLWDVPSFSPLMKLDGQQGSVLSVAFSPDGSLLASSGMQEINSKACIWDVKSGGLVNELETFGMIPSAVFLSNQRLAMAVHGLDVYHALAGIEIWEPREGRKRILQLPAPARYLAYAPQNRLLFSSEGLGHIRLLKSLPWNESFYLAGDGTRGFPERVRDYTREQWWRQIELENPVIDTPATSETGGPLDRLLWPRRPAQALADQVDLTPYYNAFLHTPWVAFYHEFDLDNDLSSLPTDLVDIQGVSFDIRGIIQLLRQEHLTYFQPIWSRYPPSIEIPMDRISNRIHVLHGTSHSEKKGVLLGNYILHYGDGTSFALPIVYGTHVKEFSSSTPDPEAAWSGDNPSFRHKYSRLYVSSYANPHPQRMIRSIEFVSNETESGPFLVALTLE